MSKKTQEKNVNIGKLKNGNDVPTKKRPRKPGVNQRSFTIYDDPSNKKSGNPRKFFFRLNDDGQLIKLGDGTYGVIYEVLEKDEDEKSPNSRYAAKLLYSSRANVHQISTALSETIDDDYKSLFENQPSYEELINRLKNSNFDKNKVLTLFKKLGEATPKYARDRFDEEIKATKRIQEELQEDNFNVMEILGGTDDFRQSKAWVHLSSRFLDSGFTVSDYILVMKLYDYTLKDLLEDNKTGHFQIRTTENPQGSSLSEEELALLTRQIRSSPDDLCKEIESIINKKDENQTESKKVLDAFKAKIIPMRGYDLLKRLDFNERIRTILPILENIARGVETIHRAGLRHRDLKPANIFIKVSDNRQIFNADVGDLGFINTDEHVGGTLPNGEFDISEVLAFGTYHYRSPEQKDYFDVCEVSVQSNGGIILKVKDPKFRNTIIEKNDFVIFSKDDDKTRYMIANDLNPNNNPSDEVIIQLQPAQNKERLPPNDEKTQVFFFKNQQVRTDLFGLGALIYDLVTAGESPERFYDEIKSFDKKGKSYEDLFTHYQQLYDFEPPDQSFVNIFRPFRHPDRREYVPTPLVKIILKCMLYNVRDNYYSISQDAAVSAALRDLSELKKDPYLTKGNNINPLFGGRFNLSQTQSRDNRLDKIIAELQQQDTVERLYYAYSYLDQLYKRIVDTVIGNDENKTFFIQLLPESISNENQRLAYENIVQYSTRGDYHIDLQANGVSKISRNVLNPFVPDYLRFMQRRIQLLPKKDGEVTKYSFNFQDTTWMGDLVRKGDWIRTENEVQTELLSIEEVVNDTLILKKIFLQESTNELFKEKDNQNSKINDDDSNDQAIDALFIQDLEPAKYYSQMLGAYLHQLFFVGIEDTPKSIPPIIYTLKGYYSLANESSLVQITTVPADQGPIEDVVALLSNIYLRLVLTEYQDSYWYKSDGNIKEMIIEIGTALKYLADLIEKNIYKNFSPGVSIELITLRLDNNRFSFSPLSQVLTEQVKINKVDNTLTEILKLWKRQYWLALNIRGYGSVSPEPSAVYPDGEVIILTAMPEEGWRFSNWEFDKPSFADKATIEEPETISFAIEENVVLTAIFVPEVNEEDSKEFNLSINIVGKGMGKVIRDVEGPYAPGQKITIEAQPFSSITKKSKFVGWEGDFNGSGSIAKIEIKKNMQVNARFEL